MWQYNYTYYNNDFLAHHGVLGQKWGIRRYQNADGSLTDLGRKRYGYMTAKENKVIKGRLRQLNDIKKAQAIIADKMKYKKRMSGDKVKHLEDAYNRGQIEANKLIKELRQNGVNLTYSTTRYKAQTRRGKHLVGSLIASGVLTAGASAALSGVPLYKGAKAAIIAPIVIAAGPTTKGVVYRKVTNSEKTKRQLKRENKAEKVASNQMHNVSSRAIKGH